MKTQLIMNGKDFYSLIHTHKPKTIKKIEYTQEAVERKALEVISKSLGYLISPLYSLKITTLF